MVCCTSPGWAARSAAMSGRLGRYMSMASGPTMTSEPSNRISERRGAGGGVGGGMAAPAAVDAAGVARVEADCIAPAIRVQ